MICESCGKDKPDVCLRDDGFTQDILNEPTAMWIACDDCDHENNMDI